MGLAWIMAAAFLAASLYFSRHSLVIRFEGVVAAGLLLFGALASAPVDSPDGRVTLEGFVLRIPDSADQPILRIGAASEKPLARLRMPGAPKVAVDLRATAPDTFGLARVALDVPTAQPVLMGFVEPGRETPVFSNLFRLQGGEALTICPGGSQGCPERRLEVAALGDGAFGVGPCDLSGERDEAGGGERIVALLDLYHYREDACVPRRIDPDAAFWARRSEGGAPVLPLQSFLLVRADGLWLARLDGDNLLGAEGLGPSEAVTEVEGPGPFTLATMQLLPSVPFEELYRETFDHEFQHCELGYQGAEADLSGAALCKRVRFHYRTWRLDLHPAAQSLYVLPEVPPSITVSPSLSEPGFGAQPVVAATYASSAQMLPDAETQALSFPFRIEDGEPLAVELELSDDPEECPSLPLPCLHTRSPSGSRAFAVGSVVELGDPDGERHLLRVSSLALPYWVAWSLIGLFALQAALLGAPRRRAERAIVGVLLVLLAARALFGFKVLAWYPHDAEGLLSAVGGAVVLPVALALAGRRSGRGLGALLALLAGAGLWAALVASGALPAPALGGDYVSLLLGLGCLLGVAGGIGILAGRSHGVRFDGDGVVVAAAVGFGVLLAVRLVFSFLGRERLGDFQLILLYWPLVVVTLLPLLARWQRGLEVVRTRSGVVARGGLLVLLLLVPCVVQALPRGDKGAALVLLPPLMVAAVMCWWPRERGVSRLLAIGVALAVVLGATGFFGVHELLDRVFPPVARDSAQWESDVRGRACPAGSPSVDDPFALTDYPRVLDRGNIGLRMDEWFLPGASNRAGTRVGAQVHESLTILQRYAAGQDGSAAGSGYLSVPIRRYGSAEVDAQLFDGVPSVLVASEGGTLALAGLLLLHMALSAGVLRRAAVMLEGPEPSAPRRSVLVFGMVVTGLIPAWTTYLMVGNNLGLFPFTGQCTPLLGVLSGTDLLLAPVLWCMAVALGSAVGRGGEHEPA